MIGFKTASTLLATAAVLSLAQMGSAEALTITSEIPGNDCPSGPFEACNVNGSPTIIKFDDDLSTIDDKNIFFSSVDGSEWSFFDIETKDDEPNEIIGASWSYTPGPGDPGITAFTVKYGDFYDLYDFGGVATTSGSFTLASNGPALSHITFFDTEGTTPIPTPALLPGLIGMGVAALRKRKGEAEESTEA